MAFPVEWGHRPVEMPLVIVRGQDFTQTMNLDPKDELPLGTQARIEIVQGKMKTTVATWDGICDKLSIEFAEESEDTDLLLNMRGLSYYCYVVYPTEPDLDFCLAYGDVEQL